MTVAPSQKTYYHLCQNTVKWSSMNPIQRGWSIPCITSAGSQYLECAVSSLPRLLRICIFWSLRTNIFVNKCTTDIIMISCLTNCHEIGSQLLVLRCSDLLKDLLKFIQWLLAWSLQYEVKNVAWIVTQPFWVNPFQKSWILQQRLGVWMSNSNLACEESNSDNHVDSHNKWLEHFYWY